MSDTSTIGDAPEGAPKQAADLPDVDTLFPAAKPDVDELFPASVEQDWRRQQMGTGWVQDTLFGEKKYDSARSILGAFGATFKEAIGDQPFGLTPETEKVLRDHGVFNDYSLGQNSILKSINEDVIRPAAVGLDALVRSFNAMMPASQAAIMKTGEERGFPHLARDIAGVPEAYMGIAHPGEIPKTFPDIKEARELGIIGEGERGWKGEPSAAEAETKPQAGPDAGGATVLPEINVPAEPDLHAEARALQPELFSEYDKLAQERDTFRGWISDLSEERDGEADLLRRAQIEKQIERVEGELAKTSPRLEELAPQVKEAYTTARDEAGIPKVPVEPPAAAESVEPGAAPEPAPVEPGSATPAEPAAAPFSIAKDTEERLIAAGRPPEEAGLHAAWTEAYWQQYAKRFQGRKGTAEEAYRRDAAEIIGEDEDKLQRRAERAGRPAPQINEDKLSLIQFMAHKGGLKQTGDLSAIFNGNPFVPRFGRLFREGGMTLDRAREAAVEAGYINPTEFIGRAGGKNTTKVSDLLNALQEESRGRKVYRPGHGPETPFDADKEAYERATFEDELEGREPDEAEEDHTDEPPSHLTEEDRRVMAELFQETGNRDTGTVHSVDASGNPQSFVDPKASQWVLYHGTPSPIPFERFEPSAANRHLSSKTEEGALFLSPAPAEAAHYAGGETSLGRGDAGPRIYPVHVTPGKTRVFDLNEMALHDPEFRRIMREQHSEYANMPTSAADRERFGAIFDQRLKDWEDRRKHLQELYSPENLRRMVERGEIDQEAAENAIKNPLPLDHFPGILSGAGAAIRMAREQGLDTAIIRGLKESNGGDQVVVLTPDRVKGALAPDRTLFQRDPAPPFYSAVERAIENAKQDKASPQQWLGTLKNMAGVKPEELEWLGLEDWLKEQTGQVTRAEIEHYVKSNRTLIREVQKGGPAALTPEEAARYQHLDNTVRWEGIEGLPPAEQREFEALHARSESGTTKYPTTTIPGGQNYREFLLTLPPRAPVRKAYTVEPPRNPSGVSADREWLILDEGGNHIESRRTEGAARQRAGELSDITAENSSEDYTKGHFDEPNVVAHIRFDDRAIDGKKTLFIQEVQSDWHQQGKKKGYGDPIAQDRTALEQRQGDLQEKRNALQPEIERLGAEADRTHEKRMNALLRKQPALRGDRDALFAELKRDAIENTTWGKRLHDLNDQEKAIREELREVSGKLSTEGVPDAPFKTTWPELTLKRMIRHAAENGYDQISWPASAEAVAQVEGWGKIENRDGKWIIRDNKDVTPIVERYLTDMPRIASKLGKKFDAKIGRAEMDGTPVFTLPLTDKLSDAAMEQGFPLFQRGDVKRGKIRLRDEGPSTITMLKEANASTFIHESAHGFLHRMIRDARDAEAPEELKADARATLDWLGVKSAEDIKTRHHEKFARGFEAYMMEGRAPNQGMARVFARIRDFMLAIYKNALALNVELTPEMRGVFDRLLGINPDDVVIAPDMAKAETLADVHEADAVHANPHQARDVANTVRSERDSHADDNLIEEEHERTADAEEGIGRRAPGSPEVHRDVDEPEIQPGEAGGHPPAGAERTGGGDAPEAGAGVPGGRRAASGGQINTEPPAGAHVAFDTPPTDLIDKAGNIRLDKLETPEDVKQVLRDAADANGGFVESRRGVMSDAEVLGLADAIGMDAASLNRRRIGQALNAEQIMAARKLLIQSATTVRDTMIKAADGTEADLLAYAEAKARHVMIQEQVAGITAEAGRALRAFRQIAGAKEAQLIGDFIKASTGQTLFQLQREARLGKQLADPAQVSKFVHDSTKPTFGDMVLEYWINGLISGPATHTTYAVGNALLALWKAGPETAAASLIGIARRAAGSDGPRVMAGEVPAQLFGMMKGMRQGVIAAYESAKSGQTSLLPGELQAMSMSQQAMSPMLNPKAMIPGPVGTLVRLPARGVAIIHSFFRAVNYQREMAALAYRTAGEEGLTGPAFAARIGDVMTNPDAALMEQARASATDLTLMGKGGELTRAASALTNATFLGAQWLKFVAPFVHIGSNVLEQALLQRTLLGVLDPEIRSSLLGVNGPIARDTAIARMAVGSALGLAVGSLAAEGLINGSGPSNPREKALWMMVNGPPHSVRVGDTWYDIHRLGPLGMLIGVTADMYEVAQHLREEGLDNKSAALVARAFTENILDESWMNGPAELIKALSDPDRYGERWVRNFASSFTPYSVGSSQIARAIDPYSRQARSTIDAIKAKIPWLSQTLLPRRDIFGEPIASKDALGLPGLSAIYEAKVNNDPTIQAMLDAKFFPGMPQHKIRGVELTDQQYDDFVRISGRMGKQRLDQIARMQNFAELPEGVRMEMMHKAFDGAREIARTTVMMQNPNILHDAIDAKKAKLTGKKPETVH